MTSEAELRNLKRGVKAAKFRSQADRHEQRQMRRGTRTKRKFDQTENIKSRKATRLHNISARRDRKNLRVKEGRGLKVGGRIASSFDRTVGEGAKTLRDPGLGSNITAAGKAINPISL